MNNFLADTVEQNQDIATLERIGTTYEQRVLTVLRLKKGNPTRSVWIG